MKEEIMFEQVKNNPQVLACIKESDAVLGVMGFTDHGLRHLGVVVERARYLAKELNLSERERELCAIASFCHDMGNFIGRTQHHYWGAMLFQQIFQGTMDPQDIVVVAQAIANHGKETGEVKFTSKVSSILVIADKSDVHRSRTREQSSQDMRENIYSRVNYGVTSSTLEVEHETRRITLSLTIDTDFVPVLEYFEIFTERMSYCRRAAKHLEYQFGLVINEFKLL